MPLLIKNRGAKLWGGLFYSDAAASVRGSCLLEDHSVSEEQMESRLTRRSDLEGWKKAGAGGLGAVGVNNKEAGGRKSSGALSPGRFRSSFHGGVETSRHISSR